MRGIYPFPCPLNPPTTTSDIEHLYCSLINLSQSPSPSTTHRCSSTLYTRLALLICPSSVLFICDCTAEIEKQCLVFLYHAYLIRTWELLSFEN